jgi:hypothetical protein
LSIYRGPGGSGDAVADSSSEATLVAQLVIEAQADADAAQASATAAAGSASTASTQASNAGTSATNAANSASTATTQASNASASASTATTQASNASSSASTATTQAGIATTQAGNASTSATTATTQAGIATTQASNASTSATNAAASETNSLANRNAAATSASAASTSASAASTSATNAASSATSASASAAAASAVALGNEPVRHSVRPSLLLDFANTKTLDPRITFTRASTATNYDGKTVAKAEENLLTYSQEFDNAAWSKVAASVTANSTTAPDGTTTAESFVGSNATAAHYLNFSTAVAAAGTFTASVYAKSNGYDYIQLTFSSGSTDYANFNLSAGTISQNSGGSPVITSVGSGWYRCSITSTLSNSSGLLLMAITAGTETRFPTVTTNGTSGVFIWGAQLEQRSSVTAYTATTTAPITNYIPALQTTASGVARFDHNPLTSESLGLLIEEQRTNLVTYSDDFANAAWTKGSASITSNTIIAPDGTLIGDALVEDTSTGAHIVNRAVTVSNATAYTFTVYAKANGRSWIIIQLQSGTFAYVNISTGATGGTSGSPTVSTSSVGNGWYRVSITGTSSSTSITNQIYLATADGTFSYAGNGYSGAFIWGAQLEAGSFATSYIPTVASQVTRSADSASMTGTNFSSWYRADEWTLYAEAENRNGVVSTTNYHMALLISGSSASTAQMMRMRGDTNAIQSYGSNGSETNQWVLSNGSGVSRGSFAKGALVYKLNDVALSSGGAAVSTDTSAQIPVLDTLQIGIGTSSAQSLNGSIKKLAYYPRRLTNAELQGLTTV